ncbi:hypothetical protein LXL04_004949 [Taraxacum kok-saghyz]
MAINPQVNNDNNNNKRTVPFSFYVTKQNSMLPTRAQIENGLAFAFAAFVAYGGYLSRSKARPVSTSHKLYKGSFQSEMTRSEAALILGVRGSITVDKVTEAHRRLMVANHPDMGGSHYLASKINEAKLMLIRNPQNTDSISHTD